MYNQTLHKSEISMKRMKYNDSDYTPTDIEIVAQEFTGGVQSSTDHLH